MDQKALLIFGESDEGSFQRLLFIDTLHLLSQSVGEPTKDGIGLHLAIQALLSNHVILFYKVKEEGNILDDYILGFSLLQQKYPKVPLSAIAIPNVTSLQIIERAKKLSSLHKCLILFSEKDLYDLMSQRSS